MSFGEIIKIGAIDTALGMGTVFSILVFISICIWLMGVICNRGKAAAKPATETAAAPAEAEDSSVIDPEIIAVITAAIHQHLREEYGDNEEYIVRKVRRATWKHTS